MAQYNYIAYDSPDAADEMVEQYGRVSGICRISAERAIPESIWQAGVIFASGPWADFLSPAD
jgi:hypothetical protein